MNKITHCLLQARAGGGGEERERGVERENGESKQLNALSEERTAMQKLGLQRACCTTLISHLNMGTVHFRPAIYSYRKNQFSFFKTCSLN